MSTKTKYEVTMTILRLIRRALSDRMGDEVPPYYEFFLERPYDELKGRTTGFINHETRCAVDMHDINSSVDFEVRIYLYPGKVSRIRSIKEDAVRFNNTDPFLTQYIIDLEVSAELFKSRSNRSLNCPDILTGVPEFLLVLGTSPTVAFKTDNGELFPVDYPGPPAGGGSGNLITY